MWKLINRSTSTAVFHFFIAPFIVLLVFYMCGMFYIVLIRPNHRSHPPPVPFNNMSEKLKFIDTLEEFSKSTCLDGSTLTARLNYALRLFVTTHASTIDHDLYNAATDASVKMLLTIQEANVWITPCLSMDFRPWMLFEYVIDLGIFLSTGVCFFNMLLVRFIWYHLFTSFVVCVWMAMFVVTYGIHTLAMKDVIDE